MIIHVYLKILGHVYNSTEWQFGAFKVGKIASELNIMFALPLNSYNCF